MKRALLAIVLVALAVFLIPTLWLRPWSIDHFYARVFASFALRHPMILSQIGVLDGTPFDFYGDKIDDLSPAAMEREMKFAEDNLKMLRSYDRRRMNPQQRLSAEVLDWFLDDQVRQRKFMWHDYPLNQMFGAQSEIPDFMINTHPLKRPKDAENYVTRVSKIGIAVDQILAGVRLRDSLKVVPPKFVMSEVLDQMRSFAGKPPKENPLYTHFAAVTDTMKGLEHVKRDELLKRLDQDITTIVIPAYQRMIAEAEHLESEATTDDGCWKLPDGDAYYAALLRSHTTIDLQPDTVHALGLREVSRIQGMMRALLRANGYPSKDVATAFDQLRKEPRFHYPANDSGRAMILRDYQAIIDDADKRVGALFDVRPKAGVRVERVPAFKDSTAPGGYYQAATISGSRPGTFFANLHDPHETVKPAMRTLAYHEAIPGHHFQISIAQELKGVPFFRRILPFTAYSEGWGLYAEQLALENGFHPTAFDSLGAYQAELFRAVRLVVDTGIHRMHWTREQAIAYMKANTGMSENDVTREVERYIVLPGQACAYKVGELEIMALRQRAMDRLGPRFDIRRFHDVVLTNGALPLGLLEQVVDEWIASEAQGASQKAKG
jgi:uncharacterized protein (DUF885 family)